MFYRCFWQYNCVCCYTVGFVQCDSDADHGKIRVLTTEVQSSAKHWPAKHWPFFGIFSKFFKNQFYIYWKNIGIIIWTRRQNRWSLLIGIVTTELVHSFYNVHELFLPRYFNLERLLGLKFFDFGFFESIVDNSYI